MNLPICETIYVIFDIHLYIHDFIKSFYVNEKYIYRKFIYIYSIMKRKMLDLIRQIYKHLFLSALSQIV